MEILKEFGIQPILLSAQIINFLIILFLLKRFFYKPITKALGERKKRIEESLENAQVIEEKLAQTEEKSAQILEGARKNAQIIIDDAKKEATRVAEQASLEARERVEQALAEARVQIDAQKIQMRKDLEKETLSLIIEVIRKVLGRSLRPKEKQELTTKAASQIIGKL